jgi:hypothetical protein
MNRPSNLLVRSTIQLWANLMHWWLIVLDFDRTLFDTAKYYRDFLEMISKVYGQSVAANLKQAEKDQEHFDPFTYLEGLNISYDSLVTDFDTFLVDKYPSGHDYVFDGANALVELLRKRRRTYVVIITTGSEQSQRFKLRLAPKLMALPHRIISRNKGEVLEEEFTLSGAISIDGRRFDRFALVDDKASALTPLSPHHRWILIQVLRTEAKYQARSKRIDIKVVSHLAQVAALLV